ncbi:MAG: serine hydrolase domain-containing protein [Candidatus Phosphoribacter sp.]
MTSPLRVLLTRWVQDGPIPGAAALLGRGANPPVVCMGEAWIGGPPMGADTIVRIQSMTKPVIAAATLQLVQAGRLALQDSVTQWLPELASRRVLTSPGASIDDTVPAERDITVRDLLTNASGYGAQIEPTPLQAAMIANGTEAGAEALALAPTQWLERLADLPLAFQPGHGWRYHHSFGILGILLQRVVDRPLQEHLTETLFAPLGMHDTGYVVPTADRGRLAAGYRLEEHGLVETEPAGAGFYVDPPFDVCHGELVSTLADFHRFARCLQDGGRWQGRHLLSSDLVAQMRRDQVPQASKTPESFFPGFWADSGWGYGGAVDIAGAHTGRFGWSGGQGTHFYLDPDGTIGILLTQVELGERTFPLMGEFAETPPDRDVSRRNAPDRLPR